MRKKFLNLFICVTLIGCTTEVNKFSDLKLNNTKGKVKSYTEYHYSTVKKFGKLEKVNGAIIFEYFFNEHGDIIESKAFSKDLVYSHKYDDSGNKIETITYDKNGTLINRTTFLYDDRQNRIELNSYYPDSILEFRSTFNFNSNDYCIKMYNYNKDGKQNSKSILKNDKNGNVIVRKGYNSANSFEYEWKYTYDDMDNVIAWNSGDAVYTYDYEFDENNNWIKKTTFCSGEKPTITEREYEYYK